MKKNFCLSKNIISEKSSLLNSNNCYVFKVYKDANKISIKNCIESLFGVKVKSVNTVNMLTKGSTRYNKGYKTSKRITTYKKAYVLLYPNEEMNFSNIM